MSNYLRVIVHLVSAVHLGTMTVIHYLNYIPPEVFRIDSAYSGKFKYLTFWNMCFEASYFLISVVDDVFLRNSDTGKTPLKSFRDYLFTVIVFPVSVYVGFTFWLLYFIDRELVLPVVIDPYFPWWLNHSVHTCIVIYTALEISTSYHKLSTLPKSLAGLWLFNGVYLTWIHVVYSKSGLWVYPVLNKLSFPLRIVFFAGSLVLVTVVHLIGRFINDRIWKKRIQDTKKKVK